MMSYGAAIGSHGVAPRPYGCAHSRLWLVPDKNNMVAPHGQPAWNIGSTLCIIVAAIRGRLDAA